MNYELIYNLLVRRGKSREESKSYEKHHIIPRCMGGTDDRDNLCQLTPREHFVAHQLLTKMYPDNNDLAYAVLMMTTGYDGRVNNRLFEWHRLNLRRPRDPALVKKTADKTRGVPKTRKAVNANAVAQLKSNESRRAKLKEHVKSDEHKKNIQSAQATPEYKNQIQVARALFYYKYESKYYVSIIQLMEVFGETDFSRSAAERFRRKIDSNKIPVTKMAIPECDYPIFTTPNGNAFGITAAAKLTGLSSSAVISRCTSDLEVYGEYSIAVPDSPYGRMFAETYQINGLPFNNV